MPCSQLVASFSRGRARLCTHTAARQAKIWGWEGGISQGSIAAPALYFLIRRIRLTTNVVFVHMPQHQLLEQREKERVGAMLLSGVSPLKVVEYTGISRSSVYRIRGNLRKYNTVNVPIEHRGKPGPPDTITTEALAGLQVYLIDKPAAHLKEMAQFLLDEYDITANVTTVFRALKRAGWSRGTVSRRT